MPTKVPKNTSLSQPSPLPQLQNSDGSSNEDQPKINSRRTSNSSDSSEDSLSEEVLNKTTSKPSTSPNPSMPSQKLDSKKTRRKKLEEDLKSHQAAAACYEEDMNTSTDTNVLAQAKTLRKNQLDAAQETESELSSMDESSSDSEKESKPDHPDTEPPAPETLKQSKPFDKPPPKPKQKHCKRKTPINSRKTQNFREFIIRCDTTFGSLSGEIPISHALPPIYV